MEKYDQWHKEAGASTTWHCWALGTSPPGDAPMCGQSVTTDATVFGATVTFDECCAACKKTLCVDD